MRKSILNFQFFLRLRSGSRVCRGTIFNSGGFSLIEILVVISVLALVAAFGVSSFGNYNSKQTLQQATSDLKNVLVTAKARATSQVKPATCGLTSSLNGYSVAIDIVNRRYTLSGLCSGVPPASSPSVTLPTGMTFTGTTATNMFFPVITGGAIITNGVLPLTDGTITLNLAGFSTNIIIKGKTGNIE